MKLYVFGWDEAFPNTQDHGMVWSWMHFYRGCFSEDVDACPVEHALVKIGCVFYRACFGKDECFCPIRPFPYIGEQRLIHPNFSTWELGGHAIKLWGGQILVHITLRMCSWCDCTSSSLGRWGGYKLWLYLQFTAGEGGLNQTLSQKQRWRSNLEGRYID